MLIKHRVTSYSIKEAVTELSRRPEWITPLCCAELRNINLCDTVDDLGCQSESSKGDEHPSMGIHSDTHLKITLMNTISYLVPSLAWKLLCYKNTA